MPTYHSHKSKSMQLQATVIQPLVSFSRGKIICCAIGLEPIKFSWKGPYGKAIQLDHTESEAYNLEEGRYYIHAMDADGATADITVDIQPIHSEYLVVTEYVVQDCSTGISHDGCITAVGHGLNEWSSFLWSNGITTNEPVIRHVKPGLYTITALEVHGEYRPVVQLCLPASVRCKPL